MALPAVIAVGLALAWMLSLVVSQGQLTAAAREGTRAAARGDDLSQVLKSAKQVAPRAQVTVHRGPKTVTVKVSQANDLPLFGGWSQRLNAQAVTAREPGV